ncbi:PRD domain-containing protein [Enterococcus casseliflavus]|uniref:PRD domain-containing protein n=1 Tax=Enterococcus casseliflavus TaxID=37734 RepID=A0A415EJK1_ENTCA|nr:PRD domain-containing protein [Enterococcus casseliflavus]
MFVKPVMAYRKILDQFDTTDMENYLEKLLISNGIVFSDEILDNLIIHLKLSIFRVNSHNIIKISGLAMSYIEDKFYSIAFKLAEWLKDEWNIALPREEIIYLAAHISAKTSEMALAKDKKERLILDLIEMLSIIDDEFLTNFSSSSSKWIEGLAMHLSPLLNRLYFNIHLENPLIDELSLKYTNVIVIAFRFGELITERYGFSLTKDEVGFIALHLAAFLEEERLKSINSVKRLIVVCATGGGSANLIRLKLEKYFPQATVLTISNSRLAYIEDNPDLFFSTIPIGNQINGVPVIEIKDFLNDRELMKIIDQAPLEVSRNNVDKRLLSLKSLFDPIFFQVLPEGEYLDIIRTQSKKMIEEGVAEEDFLNLVMERELASSTIYGKGIAGPHPIRLNAKKDSIGITMLKNPIFFDGKEIRFIMLINLKKGHLFIHKEISKLIMNLMSNDRDRDLVFECNDFSMFLKIIEKMI